MTSGGPWSVKGIDPKAREIAKDLARRSGMTLGEWINTMILEGDEEGEYVAEPEPLRPPERSRPRPVGGSIYPPPSARLSGGYAGMAPRGGGGGSGGRATAFAMRREEEDEDTHELGRVTAALERLSERIESAERRSTLAISGIDQSVAGALARLEQGEREQVLSASRVDETLEDVRETQARVAERLGRIEADATPKRTAEALKALEQALGRIAGQLYETETRTQAAIGELRDDLGGLALKTDRAERAAERPAPSPAADPMIDSLVSRVAERIEAAEARTSAAMEAMQSSFAALDARLLTAETRLAEPAEEIATSEPEEPEASPFERLAAELHARVDADRAELAGSLNTAADGRLEQIDAAVRDMTRHVEEAERRSADAIEGMGREVLRVAELLSGRVQQAEGANERIVQAVDARLRGGDSAQAEAIERLGAEITRISERLADRIGASERRSAQAIDEVGEQVSRVTDKLNQRYERSAADLSERLRQGEARTAQLLEETRERIDQRLTEVQRKGAEGLTPVQQALANLSNRLDGLETASPFGAPVFEPTFAAPAARESSPIAPSPFEHADFEAPAAVVAPMADTRRPQEGRPTFDPFEDFGAEAPAETPSSPTAATLATAPLVGAAAVALAAPELEIEHDLSPPAEPAASTLEEPFADFLSDLEPTPVEAGPRTDEARIVVDNARPAPMEDDPFAAFAADVSAHDPFAEPAPVAGPAVMEALAETPRPSSTREMLDAARAAARAASEPEVPAARATARPGRTKLAPLGEALRSEDRAPRAASSAGGSGSPLRTALFVSAALATVSVAAWGYWWMNRGPAVTAPAPAAVQPSTADVRAASGPAPVSTTPLAAAPVGSVSDAQPVTPPPSPSVAAAAPQVATPAPAARPTAAQPVPARVPAATPTPSARPTPAPSAPRPTAVAPSTATPTTPAPAAAPTPAPANDNAAYTAAVSQLTGAQRQQGLQNLQAVATRGYAPAQFYLAKVYEEGRFGVPRDLAQARRWTERAAQGGETRAMHNLGLFYFEGTGGPRDLGQAAQWFRRAADANLPDSQFNLARLYEQGMGVTANPAEAYKWYLIAGAGGDADSRSAAQRLRATLGADARAAAERSAAAFRSQRGLSAPAIPAAPAPAATRSATPPTAPIATAPAAAAPVGDPATAAAQRGLATLGYYRGPADGVASAGLRAAIVAYQRQQGMPMTGQADDALIARLNTPRSR